MRMSEMSLQTTGFTPEIDLSRCTKCGACVSACPEGVLVMQANGPAIAYPERCSYCALCEDACLEAAIRCEMEFAWEEDIL